MNKEDINIKQIRDYFAGKLDAKAMHDLEKRALDDPFLAEAMEGFENNFSGAKQNMQELATRINAKIPQKHFSLKHWLIAASVVLLLGLGTYFVLNNSSKKNRDITNEIVQNATNSLPSSTKKDSTQIAKNTDTPSSIKEQSFDTTQSSKRAISSLNKKKETVDEHKNELAVADKNKLENNNALNNVSITAYNKTERREMSYSVASPIETQNKDKLLDTLQIQNVPSANLSAALEGKVADIEIQQYKKSKKFRVIDSATGKPIAGVSIKLNNNIGIITDDKGYFSSPDTLQYMQVNSIGYQQKIVALNNKVIKLSPSNENLNDVVVVGYGTAKKNNLTGATVMQSKQLNNNESFRIRAYKSQTNDSPLVLIDGVPGNLNSIDSKDIRSVNILNDSSARAIYGTHAQSGVILITTKNNSDINNAAEPKNGWQDYKNYIDNAIKNYDATSEKGNVIISFKVSRSGHLKDLKIIKGLSKTRNSQAIEILKNGPLWKYNPNTTTGFYTIQF